MADYGHTNSKQSIKPTISSTKRSSDEMEKLHKIRESGIYKVTLIGGVVNFLLIILKFAAGIFGKSGAMIADAVHSLSDFATDVIVLVCVKISNKPIDRKHDYGHGKFETLASVVVAIVLLFVGVGIFWNGTKAIYGVLFMDEILTKPTVFAFWAAIVSIVSKEIIYQFTIVVGKKYNSSAVIANAWHHRSDAFSSIGTAIGIGGAVFLGDKWIILDPIAAVVVSLFIMNAAISILKPSLDELLDASLPEEVENEIIEILSSFKGAVDPHNLRTRRIGNSIAMDVHIRVSGELKVYEAHSITENMENKLKEHFGPDMFIAIHVEPIK